MSQLSQGTIRPSSTLKTVDVKLSDTSLDMLLISPVSPVLPR